MSNLVAASFFIESTYSYQLFEFFDSNRPADHYIKVMQSIIERDLTPYNPIITLYSQGKYWIIDGQNRFTACKELGLPIYYTVVQDGREADIMALNISQKNWSSKDYFKYYVKKNVDTYVRIEKIMKQYPVLRLGNVISCYINQGSTNRTDQWRSGTAELTKQSEDKLRQVAHLYTKVHDLLPVEGDQRTKIAAIHHVLDKVDTKRFIRQLQKYGKLMRGAVTTDMYVDELEKIYNYKRHNKVSLKY